MEEQPIRRPGANRLPAILLLALGALVMAAGVLLILATRPGGTAGVTTSPQILVDRTEIDFGQVPVNQQVKADFRLTNGGGQPLRIVGQPQVELVKGC